MKKTGLNRNFWRDNVWHLTNLPALIFIVLFIFFWGYAEDQRNRLYLQEQRNEVLAQASVMRAELEHTVNANLQLVKGLVSVIASEPDMGQVRFSFLSRALFDDSGQLRVLAGAPNLKVKMIYPYVGNESVIGLNYYENEQQRDAALRARDSNELILAGPVDLVQGGRGFIGRYPVFINHFTGEKTFWGIVSAVIDADKLYEHSGLLSESLELDIALKGHDGLGDAGRIFYGDPAIEDRNPVRVNVTLPHGSWTMLVTPPKGWANAAPSIWQLRSVLLSAFLIILLPLVFTAHLIRLRSHQNKELEAREQQLELLHERLRVALSASAIGVWEVNLRTGENVWDDRTNQLFGHEDCIYIRTAKDWEDALHPEDRMRARREFEVAIATKGHLNSQFRIITPNGEVRHLHSRCSYYHPEGGDPKMVGVNWDVTEEVQMKNALVNAKKLAEGQNEELKAAHQQIEHLAMHDELTGLPNRRLLDQHLRVMQEKARPGSGLAILSVDLDRFKQINDTLGHRAGDATLCHFAGALRANAPKQGFIGRVGGDEFVIVMECDGNLNELAKLAERIIEAANQPLNFEGQVCRFGASVGIACTPDNEVEYTKLLVRSDIALYRAKQDGRNCYSFFTDELQTSIIQSRELADEILRGIEQQQFIPYYQPQFDAHSLKIIGVEALARWNHPTKGVLSPYEFMDAARDLNVMDKLDHLVLQRVLDDMAHWRASGVEVPNASVNVSSSRLEDEGLIDTLSQFKFQPGQITFELVETIFLDESKKIVDENLARIQDMGIDIDIDDFGTGHASIVGLLRLHPKRLKIDRQFVAPLTESAEQRRLIKSIIDMGKSLNIEVLAEGVEKEDQVRILRLLGCDAFQGYLFGRPMPADAIMRFVKDHEAMAEQRKIASL
ncbi:periplasmic sensor diguanylate cyclase/phosphodiesterase [Maritalea mobilis]|uniref:Periplasmic sensor diguanylate cyclase/phosphodiesterase n=1 Tax=Maritalea mobilis TaxID=483324 RepID=A0A4R6VL76_9HYPH|nr:periplasmic sensor diguanylate cyclase/phosphodiesterase [Maritalea mobilis]